MYCVYIHFIIKVKIIVDKRDYPSYRLKLRVSILPEWPFLFKDHFIKRPLLITPLSGLLIQD